MKAREYLEQEFKNFIEKHPQARIRYEFRKPINAHFVEIVPHEIYCMNINRFLYWKADLHERFQKLFPCEGLYIFSDDDELCCIDNAELTLCGAEYVEQSCKTAENVEPKPKRTKKTK
jgi:hypothetical protein